jgi:hypothetical protein
VSSAGAIAVSGGCWIAGEAYGLLRRLPRRFQCSAAAPVCPELDGVVPQRPSRWGRFDAFARLGFSAVAWALHDAGLAPGDALDRTGLVSASAGETLATDVAFYRTTLQAGGALASPQQFSYTLPMTMAGECAISFGLRGPTLSVGNRAAARGIEALEIACEYLAAGRAGRMICGWVEAEADPWAHNGAAGPSSLGAAFVVLESGNSEFQVPSFKLTIRSGRLELETWNSELGTRTRPLQHLEEIFDPCAGN